MLKKNSLQVAGVRLRGLFKRYQASRDVSTAPLSIVTGKVGQKPIQGPFRKYQGQVRMPI